MAEKILIVEDSRAQRFFLEKTLKSEGFEVITASNGKEALSKISEQTPDLILSDIMMPEMNGLELAKSIKTNEKTKAIPIVLMTTLNEPFEIIRIIESQADYLFLKEFEQGALVAFVKDALQNKNLARNLRPEVILKSIYFAEEQQISVDDQQLLNLLLSTYRSALLAYQRYYKFKFELNQVQKQLKSGDRVPQSNTTLLTTFIREFRTPLNNILHIIDLLKDLNDQQEREMHAQLASLNADHLLTILSDLQKTVDYQQKGESLPTQETEFNVRDCIEDAISPFTIQAGKKEIDLLLHFANELPLFVKGDPNYLKHLIFVLLDILLQNLERCRILLSISLASDQKLKIEFSFPKNEKVQRIFAKFKDGSSDEQNLQVLQFCVNQLNYQFDFASSEDQSQQIILFIPVNAIEKNAELLESELHQRRVLLYSDQWMTNLVLEELLKQWGLQVKVCDQFKKIQQLLVQANQSGQPFEALIIDARPKDDAYFELARSLRNAEQPYPAPEIILLTNFGRPGDAKRCQESGIAAFLLKPIRSRELKKALKSVLNKAEQKAPLITRHSLKESESPIRILVAEDNRVNQKLMLSILQKSGYEVELAKDGQAAVDLFKQKRFDLILMDMQMPVMDGYTATREIRKLEEQSGTHTPIFALTASDDQREIKGALNAGVDEVLSKPLNLNILKEKIASFQANPDLIAT